MMPDVEILESERKEDKSVLRIDRLIALWALSEAALGGVLHAFSIPLTGLIINSSAVIFMVLIATASEKKGTILRATVIVLIVKGIVSPHTPLAAYVAVGFQGLMGEVLLRSRKYLLTCAVALGVLTLFQSAIQKILILTIVYGKILWESIDLFGNLLISQISFLPDLSGKIDFSLWLISGYVSIHVIAGLGIGIIAARIPGWLEQELLLNKFDQRIKPIRENPVFTQGKKRKRGIKKPSVLIIILLSASLFILSYFFPEISKTQGMKAMIMILRAGFILFLWYKLLGPLLLRLYQRLLKNKKTAYADQVQEVLDILPSLRFILHQTWQNSRKYRGVKRMKVFVVRSLATILTVKI
jgi:hypothetical protein